MAEIINNVPEDEFALNDEDFHEDESSNEDDENPVDWHDQCGDFTKKYNECVKAGGGYHVKFIRKFKIFAFNKFFQNNVIELF